MRKLKFILRLFAFSALLVSCREESVPQDVGLYMNGERIAWTKGMGGVLGLRVIFADINGFSEKEILNIAKSLYYISNANSCESIEIYEEKDLEKDGFSKDVEVYNIHVPNELRHKTSNKCKKKEKHCNLEDINIEADDTIGFEITKVDKKLFFWLGDEFKIDGITTEIVKTDDKYTTCILTQEMLSADQIVEIYKMVEKGQLRSVTNIYFFDHRCSTYYSGKDDYAALQPENKLIFHFVTNETYSISNKYALKKLKI